MRKRVKGRALSRNKNSRKALIRSLVRSLVLNEKVTMTQTRAKVVVPVVDKLMTLVRQDTLATRRKAIAFLGNDTEVVKRLFSAFSSLAKSRQSGFLKVTAIDNRKGDNAQMARVNWVESVEKEQELDEKSEKGVSEKPLKKKVFNIKKSVKKDSIKSKK